MFFLALFLCQYHFWMDGFSFFFAPKHLPPVFPVYPIPDKIYDASDCDFLYFVRADMRDGRGFIYSVWFLVIAAVCLIVRRYGMKMMHVIIY